MTNEEKAIEVYPIRHLKGEEREKMRERRRGFFAGANWKDVQFMEYLEKKRDKWQSAYEETQDSDYYAVYNTLSEIIKDLFL